MARLEHPDADAAECTADKHRRSLARTQSRAGANHEDWHSVAPCSLATTLDECSWVHRRSRGNSDRQRTSRRKRQKNKPGRKQNRAGTPWPLNWLRTGPKQGNGGSRNQRQRKKIGNRNSDGGSCTGQTLPKPAPAARSKERSKTEYQW
jgi:hypothetical protein